MNPATLQLQIPPYLKKGDKVAIVAPARSVTSCIVEYAESVFRSWGLATLRSKNLLGSHFQFSGTLDQRLEDMQSMLDHPEIKAIVCAGGGYGTIQLAEHLNFEGFKKHPKWLVGFSDITVLHNLLHMNGFAAIHGPMPVTFGSCYHRQTSMDCLKLMLFGHAKPVHIHKPEGIEGEGSGVLIGGNLSILFALKGTRYDVDYNGKILFIEDVDEYLYHIERMMYGLRLAGKLEKLNGLIVGNFSKVHDNEKPFGKDVQQIILDQVGSYGYPVVFDFAAGHEPGNLSLLFGKQAYLKVSEKEATLKYC
jgi:muramoyltetrapeptide carboxypeptidase